MPTGISLHIGINAVDPRHYGGWSGPLAACEADADDLEALAAERGFRPAKLLTPAATRAAVRDALAEAARSLKAGDLFWISYSGHGGQLPDRNRDEADATDETWCLFDGQLPDDELFEHYAAFRAGVRVLVTSDSCHSGTVTKMAFYRSALGAAPTADAAAGVDPAALRFRFMPDEVARRTYRDNRATYDPILKNTQRAEPADGLRATVLLVSGCQDNQLSADGTFNGLFTANLLSVWNDGAFAGDYRRFHRDIVRRMPPSQTPNLHAMGPDADAFLAEAPFTVARPGTRTAARRRRSPA